MPSRWRDQFPEYVPVWERRRRIERERKRFAPEESVTATGTRIAKTFWGQAWCRNLERYSDFANRLPRGRTYLRSGAVLQLSIERGIVTATVLGTSLYSVAVEIVPLGAARWQAIRKECAGRIDSLVALLKGELPPRVMEVVTREGSGLFPAPEEITLDCSCPDAATLCKHVAAVLYGVGVRLDEQPKLLFVLRGVDHAELVHGASALWEGGGASPEYRTVGGDLSAIFGVEIVEGESPRRAAPRRPRQRRPGR